MEIDTESCTAVFSIHMNGETTQETYLGTFKVKCILDPMDFIDSDKLYRQLLGDTHPENAHEHTLNIAFALSQLKYRILECPPFWENKRLGGSHIKDKDVIIGILNKATEAEQIYRQKMAEEAEKRQRMLTERIKAKVIEKEPELKQKTKEEIEQEQLVELDEKDGTKLEG